MLQTIAIHMIHPTLGPIQGQVNFCPGMSAGRETPPDPPELGDILMTYADGQRVPDECWEDDEVYYLLLEAAEERYRDMFPHLDYED